MFLWKDIQVVGDVFLKTQSSHKSKYHNDINLLAFNVLGC